MVQKTEKKAKKRDNVERPDEQLKAVYALNLCMVSLSQIVDYNDKNVLQQEYDTILNNLNIENFPKDESLLNALKRILDTCHFYLLHEKDKEMLKAKQAARLKGALSKALGGNNIIALVGSANPWAIASAAAMMVGVAAVNYKSERARALLENKVEDWELEKTALEQLHNLRKTLFETAWRLSADHGFKDELRLTESQISVYDDILREPDPLCRYERLNQIRDSFKAYPLYWYYLARAAIETAEIYKPLDYYLSADKNGGVAEFPILTSERCRDAALYEVYRKSAAEALKKFRDVYDKCRLLREDIVAAAAYLDSVEFIKCDQHHEVLDFIDKARDLAGLNFEILQSCGIKYLREFDSLIKREHPNDKLSLRAAKGVEYCIRLLINEEYNPEFNGRALTVFYRECAKYGIRGKLRPDDAYEQMFDPSVSYSTLKACIANKHLFVYRWMCPMTEEEYRKDWGAFFSGVGFRRALANYMEAHLRYTYKDLYFALSRAYETGSWKPIEDLKRDWGNEVKNASGILLIDKDDAKYVRHCMTWFAKPKDQLQAEKVALAFFGVGAGAAHILLMPLGAPIMAGAAALGAAGVLYKELKGRRFEDYAPIAEWIELMKEPKASEYFKKIAERENLPFDGISQEDYHAAERRLLESVISFVNSSVEKKFVTLWLYDHERSFDKESVTTALKNLEASIRNFAEFLAGVHADVISKVYEDCALSVPCKIEQPDGTVIEGRVENPIFKLIDFFESYSDNVRRQFSKMNLPPICYERYLYFPVNCKSQIYRDQLTGTTSIP